MDKLTIAVTGSAGFLGKAIIRELLSPDCLLNIGEIRLMTHSGEEPVNSGIFKYYKGDIRDKEKVIEFCHGADVVLHLASLVDWGRCSRSEVLDVNVNGTKNILDACIKTKVKAVVYTSSLDAIGAVEPIRDKDESLPYPNKFPNAYCESKALAEKAVTDAADRGLPVVSLRPCGIYGEADPFHLGSLIELAQKGSYIRVGNGKARCMHVYVGNVAHAHILAAKELISGNKKIWGKPYFITDSEPENFFKFLIKKRESRDNLF